MAMEKVLIGEILGPESAETPGRMEANERKVRARFWQTFRRAVGRIPFAQDLVAAYYCALDPSTPTRARAILLAALAYFVLPLDCIPDFLFGIGFTDDIAVLAAAIGAIRANLRESHYEAAREALKSGETVDGA
jgi:uncharacterized membrane protein YkvA (DUF1232 family)